jgi:hypothetical protein
MERISLASELPDDRLEGDPNNLPAPIGDRTRFMPATLKSEHSRFRDREVLEVKEKSNKNSNKQWGAKLRGLAFHIFVWSSRDFGMC